MTGTRAALLAGVALVFAIGVATIAQRQGGLPDLQTASLAQGPYSRMHMLLEKTFLRVDVLTVDVQVDEPTRKRLQQLTSSGDRSDRVEDQIVRAILDADHQFLCGFRLSQMTTSPGRSCGANTSST